MTSAFNVNILNASGNQGESSDEFWKRWPKMVHLLQCASLLMNAFLLFSSRLLMKACVVLESGLIVAILFGISTDCRITSHVGVEVYFVFFFTWLRVYEKCHMFQFGQFCFNLKLKPSWPGSVHVARSFMTWN